jgi:hypothetical protein
MTPIFVLAALLTAVPSTAGPEKVAFPSGYRSHVRYTVVDRPDNKTVREIYVNEGLIVRAPQPLLSPGTVITMEVYRAKVNEKGEPVKDPAGRFIKGDLMSIFVMEKRTGWGAEYPDDLRNGEWEYARFTPDGKPHQNTDTRPCFQCHQPMSGQDFVFTFPELVAAPK